LSFLSLVAAGLFFSDGLSREDWPCCAAPAAMNMLMISAKTILMVNILREFHFYSAKRLRGLLRISDFLVSL
jgi:hypothetical protein